MKTFFCDACGGLVFFENTSCLACGHSLGFIPEVLDLSAVEPMAGEPGSVRGLSVLASDRRFRLCANGRDHAVCNWLVPVEDASEFCQACRLNDVIPDLSVAGNHDRWHRLEVAKRRMVYTLLKLSLPFRADPGRQVNGLSFRFLGQTSDGKTPLTGHAEGVITINIAEADDEVREKRRVSLHEPLRTLLGHFRHEVAHYFWDRLIAGTPRLERARQLFGDETADYAAALERHYREGPPADWSTRYVTAYASAHPWEDWAETTAHYFHIIDTIETAADFGLNLRPKHPASQTMVADPRKVLAPQANFDVLLAYWFPLTYAFNELNRGIGHTDLYPFALSTVAIDKLRFIHEVFSARHGTVATFPPQGEVQQQQRVAC